MGSNRLFFRIRKNVFTLEIYCTDFFLIKNEFDVSKPKRYNIDDECNFALPCADFNVRVAL